MQDKFKTYYSNYMGMHESLTEAKYATPKAEWNDIREYVEMSALEAANAEITKLEGQVNRRRKYLQELESENKKLRAALEFYTDRAKYGHLDGECSDICDDGGKIAREALEKLE